MEHDSNYVYLYFLSSHSRFNKLKEIFQEFLCFLAVIYLIIMLALMILIVIPINWMSGQILELFDDTADKIFNTFGE